MTATILEFRQPECERAEPETRGSPPKHTNDRSAEIIIFPGVRIERGTDADVDHVDSKAGKRAKRAVPRKS